MDVCVFVSGFAKVLGKFKFLSLLKYLYFLGKFLFEAALHNIYRIYTLDCFILYLCYLVLLFELDRNAMLTSCDFARYIYSDNI